MTDEERAAIIAHAKRCGMPAPGNDPTWTRWEPDEDAKYPDNIEIGEASGFRIATVWNTPRQDVEEKANLIIAAPELLAACEDVEWSGTQQGMGYGYMGSGGDGPLIPACPSCGGIHPEKGKHEFTKEALGHRKNCKLMAALRKAKGQ